MKKKFIKLFCPVCKSKGYSIEGLKFERKNTSTNSGFNFFFDIKYCTGCQLLFNAKFENEKVNYNSKSKFVTYFNHFYFKKIYSEIFLQLEPYLNIFKKINILEFGCGDGEFFQFLNKKMKNFNVKNKIAYDIDMRFKKKNYTNNLNVFKKKFSHDAINLVICRHTLEHLPSMDTFFRSLPKKFNIILLTEVPNGFKNIFFSKRFEDIVYEHVTYFSIFSLKKLILLNGYKFLKEFSLLNNENIAVISFRGNKKFQKLLEQNLIKNISLNKKIYLEKIQKLLKNLKNKNVAFWGVSGRCLSILNEVIDYSNENELKCFLVDSDIRKIGLNINGFTKKIISPKGLKKEHIKKIIIGTEVGYKSIEREIRKLNLCKSYSLWSDLN